MTVFYSIDFIDNLCRYYVGTIYILNNSRGGRCNSILRSTYINQDNMFLFNK